MIETKFKETEVGRVPADWEVKTLGDVVYINPASEREKPDQFIYIDLESVKQGKLISTNMVNRVSAPSRAQRQIEQNDILYQTVRPYQSNNLYIDFDATKYIASTGYAVLRSHEDTDSRYVYMYLHTYKFVCDVLDNCTGTSYPAISPNKLAEISIILPSSLPEQRRIATALSDIDSLISSLDELIEKKRNIKQGTMQQLLTGKTRLNGFSEPWGEKKLGDIGYTYNGLSGKSANDFGHGNAQYITFLNILNNVKIDTRILEKVSVDNTERQNAVQKGDLFFNTSSETPEEVGICSVLLEEITDTYLNSFCFGYRVVDKEVLGLYLSYYFRSRMGRELMSCLAQGSTRYNLSKDSFLKSSIIIPSTLSEQRTIASILTSMDDEITALEQKREKYVALKQGMMQELLTGRIRLV